MGTYTANYQLYMPTIGEQGWGTLINGNYQTIDTTMKGLDTRVGTLETEGDAVAQRVGTLESQVSAIENEVNGDLVCNSVTADSFNGEFNGKWNVATVTTGSFKVGTYNITYTSYLNRQQRPSTTFTVTKTINLNETIETVYESIGVKSIPEIDTSTISLNVQAGLFNWANGAGTCTITATLDNGIEQTTSMTLASPATGKLEDTPSKTFTFSNLTSFPRSVTIKHEFNLTSTPSSYNYVAYGANVSTISHTLYMK